MPAKKEFSDQHKNNAESSATQKQPQRCLQWKSDCLIKFVLSSESLLSWGAFRTCHMLSTVGFTVAKHELLLSCVDSCSSCISVAVYLCVATQCSLSRSSSCQTKMHKILVLPSCCGNEWQFLELSTFFSHEVVGIYETNIFLNN